LRTDDVQGLMGVFSPAGQKPPIRKLHNHAGGRALPAR
jgi:hypothetical protein